MKYNHFDDFKHWYNVFQYWFAHWCAFNMTAMNMGVWKFHHLFHDWYKPWMSIFVSYDKVHQYHQTHSDHHLEYYKRTGKCNWTDLVIDWECSQFTKEYGKLPARDYLNKMVEAGKVDKDTEKLINAELLKYEL